MAKAKLLRQLDRWKLKVRRACTRWAASFRYGWGWVAPASPAAIVAVILVLILVWLKSSFNAFGELGKGVYIEAWGTVFDISIVAVILTLFAVMRDRKERINRYLEEIDDFKSWDNEEARLRLAGNVRRLIRLGKTDIDFSGLKLRDFSFSQHDIDTLKNATFSLGLRLDRLSKNGTYLEDVHFTNVNCQGVVFSRAFGKHATLGLVGKNLGFTSANLQNGSFEGAKLSWTKYEPDTGKWFEDVGEDGPGPQVYYPAFAQADLKGCSFRYAELFHADFRDADNILEADFLGAKGLETCFFDKDFREKILKASR